MKRPSADLHLFNEG